MSTKTVLEKFKRTELAESLGIRVSTLHAWRNSRNGIPMKYWLEIIAYGKYIGIDISPVEFLTDDLAALV
jgi:hypothetical protein